MTRRVVIRPEAQQDVRAARTWYRQISSELADDFMRMLREEIRVVRERPFAFQVVHRTFRRALLHRFPYALFYHPEKDRIVIVAVLHQARDPEVLQKR